LFGCWFGLVVAGKDEIFMGRIGDSALSIVYQREGVIIIAIALLALPAVHFHSEPATRAENPGFARGLKPVADVHTAARAVEWLIRAHW
jgi:hypothetical protein